MPTRRRASSYQLLKLLETTGQIGAWSLNLHTGEVAGSAGLAQIAGLPPDESLHGLLNHLIHPDERILHGDLLDLLYSGRAVDRTVRILRLDRTVRWISIRTQVILDEDHRPARVEGIALDVTASHEAQLLAEQSTARYQSLVQAIAAVVWTAASDGQARPSLPWQALTGQSGLEMQGDGWLSAIHPEDRPRTEAAWRTALIRCEPCEVDHRVVCGNGEAVWFSSHAMPIRGADGAVREWIGVMLRIQPGARLTTMERGPAAFALDGRLARCARALLNWTISDLAIAAGVSVSSVRRLEEDRGTVQPKIRAALRRALETGGIDFVVTLDGKTGVISTTAGATGKSQPVELHHAPSRCPHLARRS